MRIIRFCKTALVATVAALFTVIALGNLTDYDANWTAVQHVLSMDTIFDSTLRWRAITSPGLQEAAYWIIIGWQVLTALVLWVAVARLISSRGEKDFAGARATAAVGLTFGFLLYGLGFLVIGGEWFAMWQSEQWNVQEPAFRYLMMISAVLIILWLPDRND